MHDALAIYQEYGMGMIGGLTIYNKMDKKYGGLGQQLIMKVQLLSMFFWDTDWRQYQGTLC